MSEQEPQVVTDGVRRLLTAVVKPDDPDAGEAVQMLSERAETSTRTIYRVLSNNYKATMNLDLADRLVLAAGGHLTDCELVLPDGRTVDYAAA